MPSPVAGIVGVFRCAVVVVEAAAGGDSDVAAADGQHVVAFQALAARACGGEIERAAVDVDVPVSAHSASRFGLQIILIPSTFAAGGYRDDRFPGDVDVTRAFDTFCSNGRAIDGDSAAADVHVARVFVLVVGGDGGGRVALEVALDAVVSGAADVEGAALHQKILVAGDAVAHGGGHIDCVTLPTTLSVPCCLNSAWPFT